MSSDDAELALALQQARATRVALDGQTQAWSNLTEERATAIGAMFCAAIGAADSPFWKLGATDAATQERLGVDRPLFAPLAPDSVHADVTSVVIDSSSFIAPRFEAEIGVAVGPERMQITMCVEVADSRFAGWRLLPWAIVADATLQGAMFFGPPAEPVDRVTVTVRHNGSEVGSGEGSWSDAVARLSMLPADRAHELVATGSLTRLFDCEPGDWEFDFGPLGTLSITVV